MSANIISCNYSVKRTDFYYEQETKEISKTGSITARAVIWFKGDNDSDSVRMWKRIGAIALATLLAASLVGIPFLIEGIFLWQKHKVSKIAPDTDDIQETSFSKAKSEENSSIDHSEEDYDWVLNVPKQNISIDVSSTSLTDSTEEVKETPSGDDDSSGNAWEDDLYGAPEKQLPKDLEKNVTGLDSEEDSTSESDSLYETTPKKKTLHNPLPSPQFGSKSHYLMQSGEISDLAKKCAQVFINDEADNIKADLSQMLEKYHKLKIKDWDKSDGTFIKQSLANLALKTEEIQPPKILGSGWQGHSFPFEIPTLAQQKVGNCAHVTALGLSEKIPEGISGVEVECEVQVECQVEVETELPQHVMLLEKYHHDYPENLIKLQLGGGKSSQLSTLPSYLIKHEMQTLKAKDHTNPFDNNSIKPLYSSPWQIMKKDILPSSYDSGKNDSAIDECDNLLDVKKQLNFYMPEFDVD